MTDGLLLSGGGNACALCEHCSEQVSELFSKRSKLADKVWYAFGERAIPAPLCPGAEAPGPPGTWGQEAMGASGDITVIPDTAFSCGAWQA